VVVVLGSNAESLKPELSGDENFQIVLNPGWQEGMASSIRCGVEEAERSGVDGIIIMVCDQPFVNSSLLTKLLETQHRTGLPVVASRYADHPGVPALFHKSLFEKLKGLKGDSGARKILKENISDVAVVDFPEGAIDIDTNEDFDGLLKQQ
jgi:molybdenum cofactor cytidylyltransferase